MQEIAKGNKDALEQLYARCETPLADYLTAKFSYKIDPAEVDGVIASTMFRVWQKGDTYRGNTDRNAKGWIMRIARNLVLDQIRTRKKAQEVETELDDERIGSNSPVNGIDETSPDLATFLRKLSPREREVAELLASNYKDTEIARELGISKTRVHQLKEGISKKARGFYL